MVKRYDKSEMIEIVFIEHDIVKDGKVLDYYHHRLICPECINHTTFLFIKNANP